MAIKITYKTKFGNLVTKEVTKSDAFLISKDSSGLVFLILSNVVYLVGGHSFFTEPSKRWVRGLRHYYRPTYRLGELVCGGHV